MYSEIVKSYSGLRVLQNKKINEGFLITKEFNQFNNLHEALICFKKLYNDFKPSSKEDMYIQAKLNATVYYLRHLNGERIHLNEYILNTLGIETFTIPDSQIESLKDQIAYKLNKMGLNYTKDDLLYKFYKHSFESYNNISDLLSAEMERLIIKTKEFLDIDIHENIDIQIINKEIPYTYYLSINTSGYTLNINEHSKYKKLTPHTLKYAIIHELCAHALQLSCWKKRIKSFEINEVIGCEEDYGPEIFILEGIGESLIYFIFNDEIDPYMEIELLLDELHHCIQNNAYIMLSNNHSLTEAVNYYENHYFLEPTEDIYSRLHKAVNEPFYKANLYTYCPSLLFFKNAAQELDLLKKKVFLKILYDSPMTYSQLKEFIQSL